MSPFESAYNYDENLNSYCYRNTYAKPFGTWTGPALVSNHRPLDLHGLHHHQQPVTRYRI